MTKQQRALLALMVPGETVRTAELAKLAGTTYEKVRARLWYLERDGYVDARPGGLWVLTKKGTEGPRRRGEPPEPEVRHFIKQRPFSVVHSNPASDRYGQLFQLVRVMRCDLCVKGYAGPGHTVNGPRYGQQGGHTAHHVHRLDSEGLIPVDGPAHDLYAGLAGRSAQEHFWAWQEERGETADSVGLKYVARAQAVAAGAFIHDYELAW